MQEIRPRLFFDFVFSSFCFFHPRCKQNFVVVFVSFFLVPLLSSLPEISAARCEANVAELLAVQPAMKNSILSQILCGPLRYRFSQTSN